MNDRIRKPVAAFLIATCTCLPSVQAYEYVKSNPVNQRDPTGLWTYADTITTAGIVGGLYGLADSYSHYSDRGSNWRLAASAAAAAGLSTFTALGFGWLSGALASYANISIGAAATTMGLITSPGLFGLAVKEYQDAESYADRVMAGVDVGFAGIGVLASNVAMFNVASPAVKEALEKAATRAVRAVGGGRGGVHGTQMHTAFRQEVAKLGTDLRTEVSYFLGNEVRYGYPGSIRVDVVEGPVRAPLAIYDLKTGNSRLTPARIKQIREHLPKESRDIPIVEIRGEGS